MRATVPKRGSQAMNMSNSPRRLGAPLRPIACDDGPEQASTSDYGPGQEEVVYEEAIQPIIVQPCVAEFIREIDLIMHKQFVEVRACVDRWTTVLQDEPQQQQLQQRRRQQTERPAEQTQQEQISQQELRPAPLEPHEEPQNAGGEHAFDAASKLAQVQALWADKKSINKRAPGETLRSAQRQANRPLEKTSLSRNSTVGYIDFQPDHKNHKLSQLELITRSKPYEWLNVFIVLSNAVSIGAQAQVQASQAQDYVQLVEAPSPKEPALFSNLSPCFTILFSIDLALRWTADGFVAFWRKAEDRGWNILDLLCIVSGWLDMISMAFELEGGALGNLTVLRVIRIVRLVRIARIIRVMRFFRELRLMVTSILHSMKSLMWVLLILFLVLYMFGIAFVSGTSHHIVSEGELHETDENLIDSFGSLDAAMMTLFITLSGGADWSEYYDIVKTLGPFYSFLFIAFVCFSVFALINVVTGIFVENATQSSHADRSILVQEELQAKKDKLRSLAELFHEMDVNGEGTLTAEAFEESLSDEKIAAHFQSMKMGIADAQTLFEILDGDESREMSIQEFVQGCYELQGEATSLEVKIMQLEVRSFREAMTKLNAAVQDLHTAFQSGALLRDPERHDIML